MAPDAKLFISVSVNFAEISRRPMSAVPAGSTTVGISLLHQKFFLKTFEIDSITEDDDGVEIGYSNSPTPRQIMNSVWVVKQN